MHSTKSGRYAMLTPSRTPLKKKTLLDVVFFARASERHYTDLVLILGWQL